MTSFVSHTCSAQQYDRTFLAVGLFPAEIPHFGSYYWIMEADESCKGAKIGGMTQEIMRCKNAVEKLSS